MSCFYNDNSFSCRNTQRKVAKNSKVIGTWFQPLELLANKIPAIAQGNLDINFQEEEICLEIMVLQESLNTTITTLKKYVNDIARILQELAKGNLAVTSQVEYQGGFIKLSDSIHDITGNLSTLVKEIDNSAKQFKSISVEVSETSGQVAKGAVTQEENINRLAGKGFAVVAEEIRGLSEDTSRASESINSRTRAGDYGKNCRSSREKFSGLCICKRRDRTNG